MERAKSLHGRLNRQNCKGPESGSRRKKLFNPQPRCHRWDSMAERHCRTTSSGGCEASMMAKALRFFLGQNPVALAHPFVKIKALGVKTAF